MDWKEIIRNDIPEGWVIAFGDLLLEDLEKVIKEDGLVNFEIAQAKEKFGELRIYTNNSNQKARDIISAYSALSGNICAVCGRPDVPMTRSDWVYPCCSDCWKKFSDNKYEDYINPDESEMIEGYTIRRFILEEPGYQDTYYDCTEYRTKIREVWKKKHS